MGFGGGNFFAPQFSYNPQMSAGQASAAYMPAENYTQNVINNLYVERRNERLRPADRLLTSGLAVRATARRGHAQTRTACFSRVGGGGGGGASPYQTSPNVFDTGAAPFQGGGGSSGMGGSIYGGGSRRL